MQAERREGGEEGKGEEEAERGEISTRAGLTNDASLHMPHLPSRFMLKLQTCLYTMRVEKKKKRARHSARSSLPLFPQHVTDPPCRKRHNSSPVSYTSPYSHLPLFSFPIFRPFPGGKVIPGRYLFFLPRSSIAKRFVYRSVIQSISLRRLPGNN